MCRRQVVSAHRCQADLELGGTVHALELREAAQRNLARARDELDEAGAVFLVEGFENLPEPLDLREE